MDDVDGLRYSIIFQRAFEDLAVAEGYLDFFSSIGQGDAQVKIGLGHVVKLKFPETIAGTSSNFVAAGEEHDRRFCQALLLVFPLGNLAGKHEVRRTFFAFEAHIDGIISSAKQKMAAGLLPGTRAAGMGIGQAIVL